MQLTTLHEQAPLIWDWCPGCQLYVSHDNGSVNLLPGPKPITATRCRQCAMTEYYP